MRLIAAGGSNAKMRTAMAIIDTNAAAAGLQNCTLNSPNVSTKNIMSRR